MHIYIHVHIYMHMHVHVYMHIRMVVSQLQRVGSVRDHKYGASPFRPPPHPSGSSSSQELSAPRPDVRHAAECE